MSRSTTGDVLSAGQGRWLSPNGDAFVFRKLKPGPGLPRDQVQLDQRERLHGAMIEMIDQVGWRGVRVRLLAHAAGVSTATVYKHFANTDECFASTHDAIMKETVQYATAAQAQESDWSRSLRAAVSALLEAFGGAPRAANLALIEVFEAGSDSRKRVGPAVRQLERTLTTSFATAPRAMTPPPRLISGMTAGMLRVVRSTTMTGRSAELTSYADPLSDWMLTLPGPQVLSLRTGPGGPGRRAPRDASGPPYSRRAVNDRDRLLRAAIKIAMAEGFTKLTASRLRTEAGVSQSRFDSAFESLEDCFLQAIEKLVVDSATQVEAGSDQDEAWERRTCRFIVGASSQLVENRRQAHLVFLGIFAAGCGGLRKREQFIGRIATLLRDTVPTVQKPPLVAVEASAAASWHIAESEIASRRRRDMIRIAPLLSYVMLVPILGAQATSQVIRAEFEPARNVDRPRAPVHT